MQNELGMQNANTVRLGYLILRFALCILHSDGEAVSARNAAGVTPTWRLKQREK